MVDVDDPRHGRAPTSPAATAPTSCSTSPPRPQTVPMALDLVAAAAGASCSPGSSTSAEIPGLVTDHIVLESLQVYGGAGFTPESMARAVALIESGAVRTDLVAGEVFGLDGIDEAMALLRRDRRDATRCASGCATRTEASRELAVTAYRTGRYAAPCRSSARRTSSRPSSACSSTVHPDSARCSWSLRTASTLSSGAAPLRRPHEDHAPAGRAVAAHVAVFLQAVELPADRAGIHARRPRHVADRTGRPVGEHGEDVDTLLREIGTRRARHAREDPTAGVEPLHAAEAGPERRGHRRVLC